jgi:hypothetical protein
VRVVTLVIQHVDLTSGIECSLLATAMSTSNAANRCLALNEIARQIAFTFDAEQDGSTLLNLALTSRVLLEPALDALWNRLDDWTCLLKLLPEEILQTEGDNIVVSPSSSKPNRHSRP